MSDATTPTYSIGTIAKLLLLSERRVQQLVKERVIKKTEHGRYELAPCVQGYIKYLQERAQKGNPGFGIDYHQEKARLVKSQADKAEIELQQMANSLVSTDEVIKVWTEVVTDCKSRLLSVASKAAPIVATETSAGLCQKIIDELVREALLELGQYGNSERESNNNGGDEGMDSASET